MFKVLRKLRRQLFRNRKLQSTLGYGIGEIFLVVIGILLALQVNNWNEARLEKESEIENLIEIRTGLIGDLGDLIENTEVHQYAAQSCQILIQNLEQNLPYHDSLDIHFGQLATLTFFNSRSGAYEALKEKGLELIKNKTLRAKIIQLYDFSYDLIYVRDRMDEEDYGDVKKVYLQKFYQVGTGPGATPRNYEKLKKDTIFLNRLKYLADTRVYTRNNYNNHAFQVKELVNEISAELSEMTRLEYGEIYESFFLETHDTVKAVVLTGSFNAWDQDDLPMNYNPDQSRWEITINLYPDFNYFYRFLIDGAPSLDPENPQKDFDAYKGEKSIRYVLPKRTRNKR